MFGMKIIWSKESQLMGLIFLTVFISYSYFIHFIGSVSWNASSRLFLTYSIVNEGTLNIDKYHHQTGDKAFYKGHYYSDKAPGPSMLAVPFYLVLKLFGLEQGKYIQYILTVLVIGIPSALASLFFFKILNIFGELTLWQKMTTTLAYAFGTLAFPFATVFYGHQLAAAFGIAGFYILVSIRKTCFPERRWLLFSSGCLFGMAVLCDYPAGIILIAAFFYVLIAVRDKWKIIFLVLGAMLPMGSLFFYNYLCFGSPLSTGYSYHVSFDHSSGFMAIGLPQLDALWGITFSPYRGIFYQSPFLLFVFPGAFLLFSKKQLRLEFGFLMLVVVGFFLFNSGFAYWDGIGSAGARFLVPCLPFLVLLCYRIQKYWPIPYEFLVGLSILFMFVITATEPEAEHNVDNPLLYYNWFLLSKGYISDNIGQHLGLKGNLSLAPLAAAVVLVLFFTWRIASEGEKRPFRRKQLAYGGLLLIAVCFWITGLGKSEPQSGEYQKAEALYHYFRCKGYFRFEELIKYYDRAIAIEPGFELPYYRLAEIAHSIGNHRQALQYFDRLLKQGGNPAAIQVNKAILYEALGENSNAESAYLQALAGSKNDWRIMYRLASFYWRRNNYPLTLEVLEKANRLHPGNPTILQALKAVLRQRR